MKVDNFIQYIYMYNVKFLIIIFKLHLNYYILDECYNITYYLKIFIILSYQYQGKIQII